jgi:hypothetical protein
MGIEKPRKVVATKRDVLLLEFLALAKNRAINKEWDSAAAKLLNSHLQSVWHIWNLGRIPGDRKNDVINRTVLKMLDQVRAGRVDGLVSANAVEGHLRTCFNSALTDCLRIIKRENRPFDPWKGTHKAFIGPLHTQPGTQPQDESKIFRQETFGCTTYIMGKDVEVTWRKTSQALVGMTCINPINNESETFTVEHSSCMDAMILRVPSSLPSFDPDPASIAARLEKPRQTTERHVKRVRLFLTFHPRASRLRKEMKELFAHLPDYPFA